MFGLTTEERELKREMSELRLALADLRIKRVDLAREFELSDEVVRLKTNIADLKIDKSRLEEQHQKEERELRHMIGLEKKRQEFEIESAKKETALTVREENLAADKKRFADQMEFQQKRFEQEVGYLKDMVAQVLERLPNVAVTLNKR